MTTFPQVRGLFPATCTSCASTSPAPLGAVGCLRQCGSDLGTFRWVPLADIGRVGLPDGTHTEQRSRGPPTDRTTSTPFMRRPGRGDESTGRASTERSSAVNDNVSADEPREVRLTITPGATPARDLPFGMVSDVCAVLEAYGLKVNAPELKGHGITEVMIALGRVVEVMPHFLGGRAGVDSTTHTCPCCGVKVVGHERCGDPTRPGCREDQP